MNLKELKELLVLMEEHGLAEMEVEREGLRVRLRKLSGATDVAAERSAAASSMHPAGPGSLSPAPLAEPAKPQGMTIASPMVGTFYRAPSPESPPFAEVGQAVEVGQVVCILEAMKLMNELKSEVRGRIVQVLVENGQPVEFGQPLFLLEPL